MITKYLWGEVIFEIEWMKNHGASDEDKITCFLCFIMLAVFTPVLILIDLLFLPFEILYYLFCKWLESDKKEKKKTNDRYKILKLFMKGRNDERH